MARRLSLAICWSRTRTTLRCHTWTVSLLIAYFASSDLTSITQIYVSCTSRSVQRYGFCLPVWVSTDSRIASSRREPRCPVRQGSEDQSGEAFRPNSVQGRCLYSANDVSRVLIVHETWDSVTMPIDVSNRLVASAPERDKCFHQ